MGNSKGQFDPKSLSAEDRRRLEEGKPVQVSEGVKISLDPKTGKLTGVPKEWMDVGSNGLGLDVDESRTIKYNKLPQVIRPQSDLPEQILRIIEKPVFTKPTNVERVLHLQADSSSPFGIKGLPKEWLQMLERDGMKDVYPQNPKLLMDIVNNFENKVERKNALLTHAQFQKRLLQVVFREEDPSKYYVFNSLLGKGAMCKVYKVKSKANDTWLACRLMKIGDDPTFQFRIKTEIAVMELCKHRTIVNYMQSFLHMKCLFMVIEFMDAGSLYDFITFYKKDIPQHIIAYISREIFLGLNEMHQKGQIHRDLKSDNILVNSKGQVKVADFGFACQLTKEKKWAKEAVGTPAWMAPELISQKDYNEAVDVWSAGMIVYQLAQLQPPFLRFPPSTSIAPRLTDSKHSKEIADFVQKCMQKQPSKRAKTQQLLKHPFLRKVKDECREEMHLMVERMKSK